MIKIPLEDRKRATYYVQNYSFGIKQTVDCVL